jgi:hypothetical protein
MRKLCIVGDRFQGLARHDGISTLSGFTRSLAGGHLDDLDEQLLLVGGQGLSRYEWDHLAEAVDRRGLSHRIELHAGTADLVRRGEAHKHREINILVADLAHVDDRHYRATLRVHNDNELLLDHQTGQHVQGMVAVEAARQMFLAVTERHFASAWRQRHYYYVLNSLATTFENFLFPLAASLELFIEDADVSDPERLAFTIRVELHQDGRRCAVSRISYTAFEAARVEAKESKRAAAAIESVLRAHQPERELATANA